MMITLLTNFLKASSIAGALSIGLSVPDYGCTANALRVVGTPPAVLTGLCGTIKTVALRLLFHIEKHYVFQNLTFRRHRY